MPVWTKRLVECYSSPNGSTICREYGKTPNGNKLEGAWVYRNKFGKFIDYDIYRHDLFERHNIKIEN